MKPFFVPTSIFCTFYTFWTFGTIWFFCCAFSGLFWFFGPSWSFLLSPGQPGTIILFVSITRRSRTDVVHWLTEWWLALTWLIWPWWVMIPKEDFIYVTLVSENTFWRLVWCDPGERWYLKKTWLMWLWWVKMPSRDLTDVTLVSDDT